MRPFADSPNDVQVFGDASVNAGIGTLLRPIATPLTLGGFDSAVIDPVAAAFRDQGFVPVMAGSSSLAPRLAQSNGAAAAAPLRPGDPVGVALMSGDLELGATGTVTEVDGNRVYAFGHPFYGLGPTQFPMTRAYVHTVLPSLANSMKIASTGEVIGTVQQDRATTIAGTLGPGPALIPVRLSLTSERGTKKTFNMAMVNDQLFTPLLAYLSIVNTLTLVRAPERRGQLRHPRHGVGQEIRQRRVRRSVHRRPAVGRRGAYVVAPINFLLRNAFEDVELERLDLEIDASEQPRSATLERVWIDGTRAEGRRHGRPEDAAAHLPRRGVHQNGAGADSRQRPRHASRSW